MHQTVASEIQTLIQQGSLEAAEAQCRAALTGTPDDPSLNALLAYVGHATGRHQLAVDAALKAIRRAEDYGFAYEILGLSLRQLGRHDDALTVFERAHLLNPRDQRFAQHLFDQLLQARGYEGVAAHLRERPDPDLFARFAQLVLERGRPEEELPGYAAYRLSSTPDWAQRADAPIQWLGDAEEMPFQTPPVLGAEGREPAGPIVMVKGNAPYVADLPDITVLSKSSLLLTSDRYALNDVGAHSQYGAYVSFIWDKAQAARSGQQLLLHTGAYRIEEIEAGAWLSGLAADAFGHWLPEFMPKLEALRAHPDFADLPIIVDAGMPQSHFDYLRSVVSNPIVTVPVGGGLRCRRLLVAPTPSFFPVELEPNHPIPLHEIGGLSPRAMTFLRDRALAAHHGAPSGRFGPRLFLSRQNMAWRRMTNEGEIAAFLEARGFETVLIETLSLAEQIEMFRGAEVIVAPNGSSLLNLIFAPPEVKLLVLSQKGVFNWGCFYGTMHQLGYDMTFVCGDDEQGEKHANYAVPLARLAAALEAEGV